MSTRDDIAAALSTVIIDYDNDVHQLNGQPVRPASLALWQAFPDWQSATWLTACVVERTWNVYVILPAADPRSWAEATDDAIPAVRDALIKIGNVSRVEPIALVSSEQGVTMPALNFTLTT